MEKKVDQDTKSLLNMFGLTRKERRRMKMKTDPKK